MKILSISFFPRAIFCLILLSGIVFSVLAFDESSVISGATNITSVVANVDQTIIDREHGGLFLTKYINDNKADKGRELAEVKGLPGGDEGVNATKSFSGYLTVDENLDSNMFFWYFPAKDLTPETPLILWLNGGPGAPSTFGLFLEVGPFKIDKSQKVSLRDFSWTEKASVMFIDNPVGVGYSFTGNDKGLAKSQEDCAENLYRALAQFFKLFPDQQNRSFFIFGESYGGKYAPAIGEKIVREGDKARAEGINLKGVAVGNGLCDPVRQFGYGVNLYQHGLINQRQMEKFDELEGDANKLIREGKFGDAYTIVDKMLEPVQVKGNSLFSRTTGLTNYFNYLADGPDPQMKIFIDYIVKEDVQKAVHAKENRKDMKADKVVKALHEDMMDSVKDKIEYILDQDVPMLFYSGQLDLIIPTSFTSSFLHALEWKGAEEFRKADRAFWKAKKDSTAHDGYVQKGKNLIFQSVRRGGHMLPMDLPEVSYHMMRQFLDLAINKQF